MKFFFKFLILTTVVVSGGLVYLRSKRKPARQYIVVRGSHNIYY